MKNGIQEQNEKGAENGTHAEVTNGVANLKLTNENCMANTNGGAETNLQNGESSKSEFAQIVD